MKTQGKSVYENSDKQETRDNLYELLLPVTFEHIEGAKSCRDNWEDYLSYRHCPIAQAIKARIPSARNVSVTSRVIFTIGDQTFTYDLPQDAVEFTDTFDDRGSVKPELFRLQLRRDLR